MYVFTIGVVGDTKAQSEIAKQRLNDAFDKIVQRYSSVKAFQVVIGCSSELAKIVKEEASSRRWKSVTATHTLATVVVMSDAMIRIGGGEIQRVQIAKFKNRFRELKKALASLPVYEYDY